MAIDAAVLGHLEDLVLEELPEGNHGNHVRLLLS